MRRSVFRSANPMLSRIEKDAYVSSHAATYKGVILKSTLLMAVTILAGAFSMFTLLETGNINGGIVMLIASPIIAFISAMVALSKPSLAPFFSFIYAMFQGTFIGAISGIYTIEFGDGIVGTALIATAGVFFAMLFLYRSGIIKVTDRFRKIMFTALLGIFLSSITLFFISIFSGGLSSGMFGFYALIVVVSTIVASLYLIIDFDRVNQVVSSGADKSYEWTLSLSLLITVVWLYVELLRLIAIIMSSRR